MSKNFILPKGLIGRFAVVKLWPETQTAEDECIARFKLAAKALGLECVDVHADGRHISDTAKIINKHNVDFVIHLHYDTPKYYDAFSFAALWNPTQFYHEWGYGRCSRNMLTHDDFLSCDSPAADDHMARLVKKTSTHLPPHFKFYHSLPDIVHTPTDSLGEEKLFYIGINWEALGGYHKSRHGVLLKLLDATGQLKIYGPEIFLGKKVWDGFDSYVGEIPFDGSSMTNEIAKVGISLVLSSKPHKECELMSNRLFESIAAGALIICDENNFAKKFFGDCLLYIDTRRSANQVCEDILEHLEWARVNTDEAIKMVKKSQQIFKEKFMLIKNLSDLYLGLSERKAALLARQQVDAQIHVRLNLLLPKYSYKLLNMHITSVLSQEYKNFSPVLVIDKAITKKNRLTIQKTLEKSPVKIALLEVDFFDNECEADEKPRRRLGKVIEEILTHSSESDAVIFVAPNEKIFSNHLQVLAGSLARNPDKHCASTALILKRGEQPINAVYDRADFRCFDPMYPNGYARFIFRTSALSKDLNIALPYLDRKVIPALIGESEVVSELPATVVLDVENVFPSHILHEHHENSIIHDLFPKALNPYKGCEISLTDFPPGHPTAPPEPIIELPPLVQTLPETVVVPEVEIVAPPPAPEPIVIESAPVATEVMPTPVEIIIPIDEPLVEISVEQSPLAIEKSSKSVFRLVSQIPFFWIKIQLEALHRDGLRSRLKAFKAKIERKLNFMRETN